MRGNPGNSLRLFYSGEDGYLIMTLSNESGYKVAWPLKGTDLHEEGIGITLSLMANVIAPNGTPPLKILMERR